MQDIEGASGLILMVAIISFIFTFRGIYKKESYLVSFLTSAIISTIITIAIILLSLVSQVYTYSDNLLEGSLGLAGLIFFSILGLPILIIYIAIGVICGSIPGASVGCCVQKLIERNKKTT